MTYSPFSPIVIEPYSPAWPRLFEEEKTRIFQAISPYSYCIEHIGSTAVPSLAAKPVIDIMVGVYSLADAPAFIPPLEAIGYIYIPELEEDFPMRRYLQKLSSIAHTHHLHIVEPDSQFFKEHILFRDLLRGNPDLAAEYADLKYRLADLYQFDRPAYTDAKSDFIQKVLQLPD